jgi:hypothetical protein
MTGARCIFCTMRHLVRPFILLIAFAQTLAASEVVRVAPWDLHNSFWMSLHQTLINDAMSKKSREVEALSADEQKAWSDAVADYRASGGEGDMTFARPMAITTDALSQVADDATEPLIDAPLAEALKRAAPVYRAHWWEGDAVANQFFIRYAAGMLLDAGDELVRQHEAVYRMPWPQKISLYVTPFAGPFGAYTMTGRAGGVITTMSCRDEGYQGLHALEMILHESSHAVVWPSKGTVAAAIAAASKKHNLSPPNQLWHALLFMTSSELTKRALARRGVTNFVPSSEDLFTRVWPKYRAAVDKYWLPYLRGEGTLEEAVARIVAEVGK